jgi:hypothetical protein
LYKGLKRKGIERTEGEEEEHIGYWWERDH